ncbi:MAG: peptide ABC transporter permease [Hyphomicrobiales bacterium]|nr:MAG: peptide ABC transporter permease [Hyphomicrobiales bacterium]
MGALTTKVLRDLVRLWPQALAIALVIAAGVATLILALGAQQSLMETRAAYYDQNRFADVFASVTRAPKLLEPTIADLPGVATVETRIKKIALLDIEGMREPASGMFVSLPDIGPQKLNTAFMRKGRLPIAGDDHEVVVNEAFADAQKFVLGSRFHAILNGAKRELRVVGIALSPEFIYALGPGDLVPDDSRYAIIWMSEKALAAAYDLDGAFSSVSVKLLRNASEQDVIDRLDSLLVRYGGSGAYGRKDQISHAFLDAELTQLKAMAQTLPPIFLLVAAFLVNMTLSRLVALEREQIGLLKALGYSDWTVALHYLQFVTAITIVGIIIGAIGGTWLGIGLTKLYGDFYRFPFLIFIKDPANYVLAAGVTLAAATLGAVKAVWGVVKLPPAVAMQPPAPMRYRQFFGGRLAGALSPSNVTIMILRHLRHNPVRTASATLGIALGTSVLVASLWSLPSVEFMIDVSFYRAERQDASINFGEAKRISALNEVVRLPGVLTAEPYRSVSVKIRHRHHERRVGILGKAPDAQLSRVLDTELRPVAMPETGITVSDMLAKLLEVQVGDIVEIELMEGARRTVEAPVTAIIQSYFGLNAYASIETLNRMMREGALISGVHLSYDSAEEDALFREIKEIPAANFIALLKVSTQKFRDIIGENIHIMVSVYVMLAAIIAFGVVYNSARISLSERGRELASLRVLGFTRAEVSAILLTELAILVVVAQPLGWLLGYLFAYAMVTSFESELYRIPFVLDAPTYALSSLVVLATGVISALVVRRRIDRLDLIEVLKTRE